jgi:hypothetical protein
LLGSYSGVGQTLGHEDGHWFVNNGVAERCGPRIVREAAEGSRFPGLTRSIIISRLQQADELVHNEYHRLVREAPAGRYRTSAIRALDDIVGPSCGRLD